VRLFTSDLLRCRALAGELGGALGLAPELEPVLREQDMGAWQGRTWREITASDGAQVSAYWNDYARVAPTGGETFVELCARVEAWWERIEARHGGGELAVVTQAFHASRHCASRPRWPR
jgi:broad specificity phosphatase PhoE